MARDAPLLDAQHCGLVRHLIERLDLKPSPPALCQHHTCLKHHHHYFINGETGILVAWGAEGGRGIQYTTKLFLEDTRNGGYDILAPELDWEQWLDKWLIRSHPEYNLRKRILAWRTALADLAFFTLDLRTRTTLTAALFTYKIPKRLADAPAWTPLPSYKDPENVGFARHFTRNALSQP